MISLDVVAMFPNIPLELVKKAVSNIQIKVKSHTKLDEKEFLKGLDFIMNFTKFEFTGKFYKQKIGFVIGSVMPFYFWCVDDTLLCVLLNEL